MESRKHSLGAVVSRRMASNVCRSGKRAELRTFTVVSNGGNIVMMSELTTVSKRVEALVVHSHGELSAQAALRVREFLARQTGPTLAFDPDWCPIFQRAFKHRSYYLEECI